MKRSILERSQALKYDKQQLIGDFWNTPAVATGATGGGEVVARSAARSPRPHAPGARMTVVTQTPSNKSTGFLMLILYIIWSNSSELSIKWVDEESKQKSILSL